MPCGIGSFQWLKEDEEQRKINSDSWTRSLGAPLLWIGPPSVVQWHSLFKSTPAAVKCNITPPPSQAASAELQRLNRKTEFKSYLWNFIHSLSHPSTSIPALLQHGSCFQLYSLVITGQYVWSENIKCNVTPTRPWRTRQLSHRMQKKQGEWEEYYNV